LTNNNESVIKTFKELYELVENFKIIEESYVKDLKTVNLKTIFNDMVDVENNNFSSYYASDVEGLRDDFKLNGFMGLGLFDDNSNKIVGYIYGYRMGADGEYDDIDHINLSDINFYNNSFKNKVQSIPIKKVIPPKNTFYISNFAVNSQNRIGVGKLLVQFLNNIKSSGYQFICFDGLEDTINMFTGDRRELRLQSQGIEKLADIENENSKLTIMKFK
jgi:hypothetical protein